MNKETIYEEFFKTISESTEWGIDANNSNYGYYVDGACSMVQVLLNKLEEGKVK